MAKSFVKFNRPFQGGPAFIHPDKVSAVLPGGDSQQSLIYLDGTEEGVLVEGSAEDVVITLEAHYGSTR